VKKKTMPPARAGRVALSSMMSILTSAYIIADEPTEVIISIGMMSHISPPNTLAFSPLCTL